MLSALPDKRAASTPQNTAAANAAAASPSADAAANSAVPSFDAAASSASAAGSASSSSAASSPSSGSGGGGGGVPPLPEFRRPLPPSSRGGGRRSSQLPIGWSSGAAQGRSHFWRAGLPFLLFLTLAAAGTASMLQPRIEARDGSMAQRLYGTSSVDEGSYAQTDPNKKKTNMPGPPGGPRAQQQQQQKQKLPSLAEEYAKASKDFETDFVNKRVPRPPGAPASH
jgi:hypothetical protein